MSRASRARRLAVAAAYGGGGLGLLGASAVGVLTAQVKLARRAIPRPDRSPPVADGVFGEHLVGDPLRFVVVGDSSAAGLGVDSPHETPGALLAAGLADLAGRPVRLTVVARSGAESYDLDRQVGLTLAALPDVALIMIGANDVTHRVRPATSVRLLDEAVRRLRGSGTQVVVGTCPDLGTIEPVAQPLRALARRWSRELAAAQTIAVVEAGGRTVSLGDVLGQEFASRPREMFSADRFHPSAAGYRAAAMAMLPSLGAALELWPAGDHDRDPDAGRGEGLRAVADAAVEAAASAGTEVAGADIGGRERGPRGRWALLRHRRRTQLPDAERVAAATADPADGDGDDLPSGHDDTSREAAVDAPR